MITGCSFLVYVKDVIINLFPPGGSPIMIKRVRHLIFLILLTIICIISAACRIGPEIKTPASENQLRVVVTTTFLADIVGNIAGDVINLVMLLEPGQNPHSYLASPRDLVNLTEADVLFMNGFGLEEFLDEMLEGSDFPGSLVVVSEGISPLLAANGHDEENANDKSGADPHVWLNPNNIKIWVDNIAATLVLMDPGNGDFYKANAEAYLLDLKNLDAWIRSELDNIPLENREIVSDHSSLGYFIEEYDLNQIGSVIPALTTEAETSGQHLAGLIETIREYQAKAIFVGVDFNPTLAQRVSDETGIDLVPLYFGSLSKGPPADTYLRFMRYNVESIVNAIK